jgi:hypothetical protein
MLGGQRSPGIYNPLDSSARNAETCGPREITARYAGLALLLLIYYTTAHHPIRQPADCLIVKIKSKERDQWQTSLV